MAWNFPKINFERIIEELDVKWTAIFLVLLFFTYIVGKTFLVLFTSLYGWILVMLAIAIIVSPEFNAFLKEKILMVVDKFRNSHMSIERQFVVHEQ